MAGPTALPAAQMKAIHVYMGGIGLQQFFIFVFLGLAVGFHREMLGMERGGQLGIGKGKWRGLLYVLYASLGLITIRIFFRLIEFSGGKTSSNPLPFHEVYFYALEAVPMFLAILTMNIVHPGNILNGPDSKMPSLKQTLKGMLWKRKGKVIPIKEIEIEEEELVEFEGDTKFREALPRYSKYRMGEMSASM